MVFGDTVSGTYAPACRSFQVRAEVGRYGADVICLQECDSFDAILASLQDDPTQVRDGQDGIEEEKKREEMKIVLLCNAR